ncbi:MAG: ParA family protein [Thermodesulfovibrio sp.]|nr:ParA family protein [Thermodesulfovibrio sp.]
MGVGFEHRRNILTAHSLFLNESYEIEKAIYNTKWDNLYVSPADPLFEHQRSGERKDILKNALMNSKLSFDFIIIDTAPSLDNLLINALVASDFVLIPFQPHFLSIEGIRALARVFFRIASTENPNLKLLGLIPVMLNLRIHHQSRVTENLSTNFGREKILPGIRVDIKVVEAFEHRMPLRFYAPTSRASQDFKFLSNEILNRINLL